MSSKVKVPLRPGSDGDATHVPTRAGYSLDTNPVYREKLATLWMKDRGENLPGVSYILEQLPTGYAQYGRPREKDPKHIDRYLYGHPDHKPFDSPNRFYPHFKHLMENGGDNMGCPCTVCIANGGTIPPMGGSATSKRSRHSSGASQMKKPQFRTSASKAPALAPATEDIQPKYQPKGRPKMVTPGMDTSRVDEEGTPDVYRNLINKLKKESKVDEQITEPMSLDWRAEQECLPRLKDMTQTHQCLPRVGEIVLFVRQLPEGVSLARKQGNPETFLYDAHKKEFLGLPKWEAGYVGQVPRPSEVPEDIEDLVNESSDANVSLAGVRVEPLPDPNSIVKSASKQYTYVSLHQTRPFVFWKEFLNQIPEEEWHPTIHNALTAMASFSLVDKHRFRGTWPEAWIYCHGIYLGSELLTVGDTIRILRKTDSEHDDNGGMLSVDVLVIKTIRLKLSNLDLASENDYDEGRPYNSTVYIFGKGYTTEQSRSSKQWLSFNDGKTAPMDGYPSLHPLHPAEKEMVVPLSRVMGRLFESKAMSQWCLDSPAPTNSSLLSVGAAGLSEARAYARDHDSRINSNLGGRWFWGDNRAEALDLREINGLTVSTFDVARDPKEWRKTIKTLQDEEQQMLLEERKKHVEERGLGVRGEEQRKRSARDFELGLRSQDIPGRDLQQQFGYNSGSGTGRGTAQALLNSGSSGPGMGSSPLKRPASQVIDLSSGSESESDDEGATPVAGMMIQEQLQRAREKSYSADKAKKARVATAVVIR